MACILAYIALATDFMQVGYLAFGAVSAALIIVTGVSPMLLGARPKRLWVFGSAGCFCLLLSLVLYATGGTIGPFSHTDVVYFLGYVFTTIWLVLLWRRMGVGQSRLTVIDAATAASASLLVVWAVAIAPVMAGTDMAVAIIAAVYPTMDMLLLVVVVNMVERAEVVTYPLRMLVLTFGYLLALDTLYTTHRIIWPQDDRILYEGAYLFFFLFLALAATHPSIKYLGHRRQGAPAHPVKRPGPFVVFLTNTPIILSTLIQVVSPLDVFVRVVLVVALLSLLFGRLTQTMKDLSRAEGDSRHRATHDGLTGLLNRPALVEQLSQMLARNATSGRYTAVLFLDCDDFKQINDTWGHDAGDRLLTEVAGGLPVQLRPGDVLARHGGDEFVIAATLDQADDAKALAEQVLSFFADPLTIAPGHSHKVSSSVGVAIAAPAQQVSTQDLLSWADIAMYEAKRSERGRCVVFDDSLAQESRSRAAIGARLGEALHSAAIDVQLQPIMGGSDYHRLVGWEALARWHDPELGEIAPDVFVPVAEQLGLVGELGELVLRRACRDLAVLRRGLVRDDLVVSVNTSPAQLRRPGLAALVQDACADAGLDCDALVLEVTETLIVGEGDDVLATLSELHDLGVVIVIDDFGTGYASLSILLRLPVDGVKLDKTLVAGAGTDGAARRQLGAVVDLVRSLGIECIVAEGVETPEQQAALRELEVPMTQGWLYGRATSASSILTDLSSSTGWGR